MTNKEKTTKLLVAGHFGAGKTTFVKTASLIKTVETERKATLEEEKSKKRTTTVAMDYGEYQMEDGRKVNIFGVPGQKRFSFMWSILAKNTETVILLLDSTDTSRWFETFEQINVFRKEIPNAKFVFVANKRDLPSALPMEEIKKKLKLPSHMKLLECVATDKESVVSVIKEALNEVNCKTVTESALVNS